MIYENHINDIILLTLLNPENMMRAAIKKNLLVYF